MSVCMLGIVYIYKYTVEICNNTELQDTHKHILYTRFQRAYLYKCEYLNIHINTYVMIV